ncbi:MAG TPA: hypothetical protein VN176_09375 [Verrucomicrobiae bacterium]|jgi:hypothetical protein|nr:hypothetical protein [Verrucomicrobiae bacterium]
MKKLRFTSIVVLAAPALAAIAFAAQQAQPASAPAQARRTVQAKTQPEFKDYNKAYAVAGGAAMEKAADDFAAKYPTSELRGYLYAKAMHEYQTENNPGNIVAMGEKVLSLDPDNSLALVLTATVIADKLSDAGTDREQQIAEIKKNSNHALETVDSSFVAREGFKPEEIAAYKNTLRCMARSALGIMELKTHDDAAAEKDLQTAADLMQPESPDPYIWYHLALSQDHQEKYAAALVSVTQALQHVGSNPDLAKLAQGERARLMKLTGANSGTTQKSPQ